MFYLVSLALSSSLMILLSKYDFSEKYYYVN